MKVTRLSTTPIKGLALHHPSSIEISARGAVGDREFFIATSENEMISSSKEGNLSGISAEFDSPSNTLTVRENGSIIAQDAVSHGGDVTVRFFNSYDVEGQLAPGPWDKIFSDRIGSPVRLVRSGARRAAHDMHPLSVLSRESIRALEVHSGVTGIDPRRFRILIEIEGVRPHEEEYLPEKEFRVGQATIRMGAPIQRCDAITRNPESGEVDLRTLKLIFDYRGKQESELGMGLNFGSFAYPVQPGRISVGDEFIAI